MEEAGARLAPMMASRGANNSCILPPVHRHNSVVNASFPSSNLLPPLVSAPTPLASPQDALAAKGGQQVPPGKENAGCRADVQPCTCTGIARMLAPLPPTPRGPGLRQRLTVGTPTEDSGPPRALQCGREQGISPGYYYGARLCPCLLFYSSRLSL